MSDMLGFCGKEKVSKENGAAPKFGAKFIQMDKLFRKQIKINGNVHLKLNKTAYFKWRIQMLKGLSKFVVLAAIVSLSACNSSSGGKKDGVTEQGGAPAGGYLGTYEASNGCTTGTQTFTGATEEEISAAFCGGLTNETLNKN